MSIDYTYQAQFSNENLDLTHFNSNAKALCKMKARWMNDQIVLISWLILINFRSVNYFLTKFMRNLTKVKTFTCLVDRFLFKGL